MKSDFISFGETWLHNDETVSFEAQGFDGIHANVGDGQGLATFSKILYKERTTLCTDKTFSATLVKNNAVDVISLYLSKGFNWLNLRNLLDEWIADGRCVTIIGDVNLNYSEALNNPFIKYLEERNFKQLIKKPTHEKGGLIDHIWINKPLQEKEVFSNQRSVYYSDHDCITLHIPI